MKAGRGPMMKTGRGIPQTFQSPENQAKALLQKKQDPKDGDDQIPSYEVQNTKTVNVPEVKGSTKTTYKKPVRTPEGDEAYAKLTPAQRKAQDAKYKKLNTTTTTSKSKPAETNTVQSSETKTIGTETVNSVKAKNEEAVKNRQKEAEAKKKARLIQKRLDSGKAANKYLNKIKDANLKITPYHKKKAQEKGDKAALRGGFKSFPKSVEGRQTNRDEVLEISQLPNG